MKQKYEYIRTTFWELAQKHVKEGWRLHITTSDKMYILERAMQDESEDDEPQTNEVLDPYTRNYTIGEIVGTIHNEIDNYFKMETDPESFNALDKKYVVIGALRDVAEKIIRKM